MVNAQDGLANLSNMITIFSNFLCYSKHENLLNMKHRYAIGPSPHFTPVLFMSEKILSDLEINEL